MRGYKEKFGELNGYTISAYTIINSHGMKVICLDYGCIINKIIVPDKYGKFENVVLGFDSINEYVEQSPYFGAVIGRVAGRINKANFELNNQVYQLAINNKSNHLHGGLKGFDKVIWNTEMIENKDNISLVFTYQSPDGEEGYPGNIDMKVVYTLNNKNELNITYEGKSDQRTLLNVTNHSYFNLSGDLKRDVLNHTLKLKSKRFVELDHDLIPTGRLVDVDNTPFDFTVGRKLIDGVESSHPQNILAGNGYDHPFLLEENDTEQIILSDEENGRVLMIETNQPGVVLYTGTQLLNDFTIRSIQSRKYLGLCLETQGLPDSIHHDNFPSCIIEKDEDYHAFTKLSFLINK
ncbi:aldose epimerase family protein [Gottfriedia acidiceleris]|uniref:Aldose 1-epimerase n=1 Tax=Gottfriedia acidiceleris TaxID=371036 RepID=A0ABY4JML8_9BACI|nr:aldose epimerase family protein [Gottfriedia acidiceleris]UPM55064.1 galactose mutarotase [Gottfriedia acidiceleris]